MTDFKGNHPQGSPSLKKGGEFKKHRIYIGIDTGVNTGLAVWDKESKQFLDIQGIKIHAALEYVRSFVQRYPYAVMVRVEDARLRKWFGVRTNEKLQGAGSVKRDAKIWEDFLTDLGCDFEMVDPKNNVTKLTAKGFRQYTGWAGLTNEHMRDAGMLVYNF